MNLQYKGFARKSHKRSFIQHTDVVELLWYKAAKYKQLSHK